MENKLEYRISSIIENWLDNTFHNSKALPQIMLIGIAKEIANHRYEIYDYVNKEYALEDIESIEMSNQVKLTDEEKEFVLDKYMDYSGDNIAYLEDLILNIIYKRKERSDDSE